MTVTNEEGQTEARAPARKSEIKFEIMQHLGVLSSGTRGWQKELNLVSWNGGKPKLDLRDWDENHEKMGKGVTLTPEEAEKLADLLGVYLGR